MISGDEKIWRKEFQSFLEETPVPPPDDVTRAVFAKVHGDLNPRMEIVFGKLSLAHSVAAVVVVSVCPQLGVGPLLSSVGHMGLMSVFMQFGPVACSILCGAFFLSTSQLLGALVLRQEELRKARVIFPFSLSFLVALSLGVLMLAGSVRPAGAELLFWAFGAILGGFFSFQAGLLARGALSVKSRYSVRFK